jgi:tetratricopeptide (TPR) repeat protein
MNDAAAMVSSALEQARGRVRAGDPDGAVRACVRALAADPGRADAWSTFAVICMMGQRFRLAIRGFGRATRATPGDAESWGNMAIALLHEGDVERAIEANLRAIEAAAGTSGQTVEHCATTLLALLGDRADLAAGVERRLIDLARRTMLAGSAMEALGRLLKRSGHADEAARLALDHLVGRGLGYRASFDGPPVDAEGRPVPLYTYPCIAYLSQIDWRERVVFEYGGGHSTLFWAARARRVYTVEHDADWHAHLARRIPANVTLRHAAGAAYAQAINDLPEAPDIIVVDGVDRRLCAEAAKAFVPPHGLAILDNGEWHPETAATLRAADLIQVDFAGLKPGEMFMSTTSLFLGRAFSPKPATDQMPAVPTGGRLILSQWDRLP